MHCVITGCFGGYAVPLPHCDGAPIMSRGAMKRLQKEIQNARKACGASCISAVEAVFGDAEAALSATAWTPTERARMRHWFLSLLHRPLVRRGR